MTRRRMWQAVVLGLVLALTLTAVAGAAKPEKCSPWPECNQDQEPEDPPAGSSLAVTVIDDLHAEPTGMLGILEAPGDTVRFVASVDEEPVAGDLVVNNTTTLAVTAGVSEAYAVSADDVVGDKFVATVSFDSLTTEVELDKYTLDTCALTQVGDEYQGTFEAGSDACRWSPGDGAWQATVKPLGVGRFAKVQITMRDHVPGNWCATTVDGSGAASGRNEVLVHEFYLPADGICLVGGGGGDQLGVGNATTFVLAAEGHVTLTRIGDTP